MTIYENIGNNIKYYMNVLENDIHFKSEYHQKDLTILSVVKQKLELMNYIL